MADAYASHLPMLTALGAWLPVRRALELGGGRYSTLTLLDRARYPHLEKLVTVETDAGWREWLRANVDDARWELADSIPPWIGEYDLVFIDDGHSLDERVASIEAVSAAWPCAAVVIHDFEQTAYQRAADFDWLEVYTGRLPWTALAWNGERAELEELCHALHLGQAVR